MSRYWNWKTSKARQLCSFIDSLLAISNIEYFKEIEMKFKKGFTLIELLVVIAIIALLLGILMPALSAVKERAKTVVCKTNLHTWGLCYQLYTNDYNNKLPLFVSGTVEHTTYMESLRPYYNDSDKARTCPSAAKVADKGWTPWDGSNNIPGRSDRAWYIDTVNSDWNRDDDWGVGSYCENTWIRGGSEGGANGWGSLVSMRTSSEVPLMLDGKWNNVWAIDDVPVAGPTTESEYYSIVNYNRMQNFAMRRHGEGVNAAMADMSAISIIAEDLWTMKWHRNFERKHDVDLPWVVW